MGAFCRTATTEEVFFIAAAVLLGGTCFAGAFLSGFDFLATEAFVPACFDLVGRFAAGEALAEVFAGDVTLAASLMDEPLTPGSLHHFRAAAPSVPAAPLRSWLSLPDSWPVVSEAELAGVEAGGLVLGTLWPATSG